MDTGPAQQLELHYPQGALLGELNLDMTHTALLQICTKLPRVLLELLSAREIIVFQSLSSGAPAKLCKCWVSHGHSPSLNNF